MFDFSVVPMNDEENANATSSEILDEVLKQLDKLGAEKRSKILKKLNGSSNEKVRQKSSISPKSEKLAASIKKSADTDSQDEVEVLDFDEPKLGTYKRKRSKILIEKTLEMFRALILNLFTICFRTWNNSSTDKSHIKATTIRAKINISGTTVRANGKNTTKIEYQSITPFEKTIGLGK